MTAPQWLGVASGVAYAIGAVVVMVGLYLTGKALAGEATAGDVKNLRALLRTAGGLQLGYIAAVLFLLGAVLQIAGSVV